MKIKIVLPKPRNPLALPARQRKAGAHTPDNPARSERRKANYQLRLALTKNKGDDDA